MCVINSMSVLLLILYSIAEKNSSTSWKWVQGEADGPCSSSTWSIRTENLDTSEIARGRTIICALVPVCWMLKLPGVPKQSEDIQQLCSRLASIGSDAQACTSSLTRGGPSHPGWLAGAAQRVRVSARAVVWRRPAPAWKAMGRRVARTGSDGETAGQRQPTPQHVTRKCSRGKDDV